MIGQSRGVACTALLLAMFVPGCATATRPASGSSPVLATSVPPTGQAISEPTPPEAPTTIDAGARAVYQRDLDTWLAPPPADQPQPKFVCARPEIQHEPVWFGQKVTYRWEIGNAGQAPLRIHLME
jgi:hypothetical protein